MSEQEFKEFEKQAQVKVDAYVKKRKMATVADIVKKFPRYQRVIVDVLDDLKEAGKVYWDEWRPLPTMIYTGDHRDGGRSYDWISRQTVTSN